MGSPPESNILVSPKATAGPDFSQWFAQQFCAEVGPEEASQRGSGWVRIGTSQNVSAAKPFPP